MIDLMGNEWKVIMEKVNGKMKTIDWRGEKETYYLCQSVSDERRDRIIQTKNKGDHVGLAIAYWFLPPLLYPTIVISRFKSLFLR